MASVAQEVEHHCREHFTTLVKRLTRPAGSKEDAEDVIQEAYIRALRYSNSFQEGMEFHYWFTRILSNALKAHKNAQREMGSIEEPEEHHFEPVEDSSLLESIRRDLNKEIGMLQQPHKEIIELHFLYGYSNGQIKSITNEPYLFIHGVIQRFKNSLKEKYADV